MSPSCYDQRREFPSRSSNDPEQLLPEHKCAAAVEPQAKAGSPSETVSEQRAALAGSVFAGLRSAHVVLGTAQGCCFVVSLCLLYADAPCNNGRCVVNARAIQ